MVIDEQSVSASEDPSRTGSQNSRDANERSKSISEAEKRIKGAWIIAAIISIATTTAAILAFTGLPMFDQLAPRILLDVLIVWPLTYFMYKRSFIAFVLMILYWSVSVFEAAFTEGVTTGLGLKVLFLAFFIRGASDVHKLIKLIDRETKTSE